MFFLVAITNLVLFGIQNTKAQVPKWTDDKTWGTLQRRISPVFPGTKAILITSKSSQGHVSGLFVYSLTDHDLFWSNVTQLCSNTIYSLTVRSIMIEKNFDDKQQNTPINVAKSDVFQRRGIRSWELFVWPTSRLWQKPLSRAWLRSPSVWTNKTELF